MQTTAAVLVNQNQPLSLQQLSLPELAAGQVLVQIEYSGVCHSQLNEINGAKGPDKFLPHTLGHEGAGIVQSVGAGVTKVKPGDHVVMTWIQGGGLNVPGCRYTAVSEGSAVNSGAISTFSQHAVVSENRLVPISKDVPLKVAALLGCAVPTGAGMIKHLLREQDNSVAVFGCGGIGMSAVLAAGAFGAEKIIAVDVFDHKLSKAQTLGATAVVNATQNDAVEAIRSLTDGKGAMLVVESAGLKTTMEQAFRATADSGRCVLAGNLPDGQTISIDPFDLIKGKQILGTWGGGTNPDQDIPQYVAMYQQGRFPIDLLITHEYSLEEINTACEDLRKGSVGRALIKMHVQDRN